MGNDTDDHDAPVTGKEMLDVLRGADHAGVQKALRKGNIKMPPTDKADALRPWINRILKANGIGTGAYISDKSMMWDFMPFDPDERLLVIQERLGIEFDGDDYVFEVAARLRDAEAAQEN